MGYSRAGSLSLFRALVGHSHSRVLPAPVRPVGHQRLVSQSWLDTPSYVLTALRLHRHQPRLVIGALGHHRPGDARRLVGQRDRRDVVVPRLGDVRYPATHPIIFAGRRS